MQPLEPVSFRIQGVSKWGLAEAEGFEQTLEIGALQPQGLGGRRMIALGLGQRLAQQRALEGHRGGMIRQGRGDGGREERRGLMRDGGRSQGDLGPAPRTTARSITLASSRTLPGQG